MLLRPPDHPNSAVPFSAGAYLGELNEVCRQDQACHDDHTHTSEEQQCVGIEDDELDQAVELSHGVPSCARVRGHPPPMMQSKICIK